MSESQSNSPAGNPAGRLDTVTPSRYGALRAWKDGRTCALQLLWRGRAPLAPYPAAKLGDVVHRMLDRLPYGASKEEAELAWKEALEHTESLLGNDWVTRGLLPLERTVRRYALKRILSIRSVLPSGSAGPAVAAGEGPPSDLREEDLLSEDGVLKGRADLIEQRDGEWVLVDYKSGSIHEDDEESGGQRIKDEYALQLRLYAHLIQEAKGIKVSKALLRTLDGVEHEVAVDEASVQEAGREARALLGEFNAEVQRHETPFDLARPMPSSRETGVFGCAGCLFRSLCPAYLGCEKPCDSGERWPTDAWGKVTSMERKDGTVTIRIRNENHLLDQDGNVRNVEVTMSLKDSAERHPELDGLQVGSEVQVYDYIASRFGTSGSDGPRTCVYQGAPAAAGGGDCVMMACRRLPAR